MRRVAFLLLAISVGSLFAVGSLAQAPPPPGNLVDIGGYRLHLFCEGAGSPTVVLSAGAGDFSVDWALVRPTISKLARVCSYDRAGEAWSDAGPVPRTLRQEAYELHLALNKAGEHGPYILVGHSLGGLTMRIYAERFPDEVAGVVLVDATSEDATLAMRGKLVHVRLTAQNRPIPDVQTFQSSPPQPLSEQDRKDFLDMEKQFGPQKTTPPYTLLPPETQQLDLWARSQLPKSQPSDDYLAEELQQMYLRSQKSPPPLGDKPLFIIIAGLAGSGPPNVSAEEWKRLNEEKVEQKKLFAMLSTNSKVLIDEKSGHHVQIEDPQTVIDAIRTTRDAAQHHTQLKLN